MSKLNRYNLLEILYILILPICVWSLYKIQLFNNGEGFLDPWIYLSYANNFEDLINRYGLPYYSIRFGLIFPLLVLIKIFGSEGGYYSFIYLYYLIVGIPFYLLFRKHYSINTAVFAYAFLISSLWLARTVLWTHPDASAVPYMMAGVCLIFIDPIYRKGNYFIIGILFGLAVNSNFFTISICGLSLFGYLGFHGKATLQRLPADFFWAILGFTVVNILGSFGYYVCCGTFNIYQSTIDIVRWGLGGSGAHYKADNIDILKGAYVYLPPFIVLAMLALYRIVPENKKSLFNGAVAYAISVLLFVYYWNFASIGVVLDYFYYFSYFIPSLFICIVLIPIVLVETVKYKRILLNTALSILILVPLLFVHKIIAFTYIEIKYFYAVLIILLIAILAGIKFKITIPLAILLYVSVFNIFWMNGNHAFSIYNFYGASNTLDLKWYELSIKFISALPKHKDTQKPIYFWYRNEDKLANSLQSTYLWGYSRIMDTSPETPGLPSLKGVNLDSLQQPASIVLFDHDSQKVEQGINEFQKQGLKFNIKSTNEICENEVCYTITVLNSNGFESVIEKKWNSGELAPIRYDLTWNNAGSGAVIEHDVSLMSVNTPPLPWNYAAVGSIVYSEHPSKRPGVVRIEVSVSTTSAGIGFTGDNVSNFINRIEVLPEGESQELFFEFDNFEELKNIVVSSWGKAESSRVEIRDFEIRLSEPNN